MLNALAINGSPLKEKGDTALILSSFLEGMASAGCNYELFYTSRLKIKPCACGMMHCWYGSSGECLMHDDMQILIPKLKASDILILATPVYIPLPGTMQNLINRLCPLLEPRLVWRNNRTRARFHKDVKISQIVLVATGGWWEIENFNIVVQIVQELAENASVEFSGAVLRPHAFLLKSNGKITDDGKVVLHAVKIAGEQLISKGIMQPEILADISHPLIYREELQYRYNRMLD